MYLKRLLCGVALAAGLGAGAQAAVVDLTFSHTPGVTPALQIGGNTSVYLADQLAFRDGALAGNYSFHFTYDTEASDPNYGLTLVSGQVGTLTDFSGFTTRLTYIPSSLLRIELFQAVGAGSGTYGTLAMFNLLDDDGDLGASLPTSLDFADLDAATANLDITRAGSGVGGGYYRAYFGATDGRLAEAPGSGGSPDPGGPVGAVPEPATWASMILGFGLAGRVLRRRAAVAYAASNWSAASRA